MKVILRAERPIALDSPDHIMPCGTRLNNSTNKRFNNNLWRIYPANKVVKVLDLGCAGGGFVKSCIDDGHFAVGLEGSDFSKTYRRAAWPIIPEFLFTCDISRPFQIVLDDGAGEQMLKFDVVTAWEFIEHIKEEGLPSVAQNVHSHLAPGGLFISSLANCEDVEGGARLHQTVRPETWWRGRFQSLGFEPLDEFTRYFAPQFVRGARWDNDLSFHFVLTNDRSRVPQVPTTSLVHRLYDTWLGSKPQRFLSKLIVGPS